jgi:hypothetical protein
MRLGIPLPIRVPLDVRPGPRSSIVGRLGCVGSGVLLLFLTLVVDAHTARAHSPHGDVADIAVSPACAEDRTVFTIVRGKLMRSSDVEPPGWRSCNGVGGVGQVLARGSPSHRPTTVSSAGFATVAALWTLGVGGRRTRHALALRMGGLVVAAVAFVVLAA